MGEKSVLKVRERLRGYERVAKGAGPHEEERGICERSGPLQKRVRNMLQTPRDERHRLGGIFSADSSAPLGQRATPNHKEGPG